MTHTERYEVVVRLMRVAVEWREALWQEWYVPRLRTKDAHDVDVLCAEMQARFSRGKR